jgi:hypothetical protein
MKSVGITSLLLIVFSMGFAQQTKIEVIDFHSTNRCITCKSIEANAKKTVDTYFANNDNISFMVYNVDDAKNEKIAAEFQAAGTSLFLRVTKGSRSQIVDLTQFAFMNGRNEEKFLPGLKEEIEKYL